MRLVVIMLVGCSSHSPPNPAIERCTQGVAAIVVSGDEVRFTSLEEAMKMEACADLYRAPACANAWRDTMREEDEAPRIAEACTQAYCGQLADPPALCRRPLTRDPTRVDQLRELDIAILTFEGLDLAVAHGIARRTVLFRKAGKPPASESLVIDIDELGALTNAGTPIDRATLPQRFAQLAAANGRLVIRASHGTTHGKVVELMEAAKRAGIVDLAIGAPPD